MARTSAVPPFHGLVYSLVRRIPRGKVMTYGQIAAVLGRPRAARAVGRALGVLDGPLLALVPWHRVVNAAGRCSPRGDGWAERQRERLELEGVRFGRHGRIDLRPFKWTARRRPRTRPAQ